MARPPDVLVHVVLSDGQRYEFTFRSGTPKEKILADLDRGKRRFGFAVAVVRRDETLAKDLGDSAPAVPHGDPASGFLYDDSRTRVVVGRDDGRGGFVEFEQLKGPAPEKDDTPADPAPPADAPEAEKGQSDEPAVPDRPEAGSDRHADR